MSGKEPPDNADGASRNGGGADFRDQFLGAVKPRRGRKTEEWLARVTSYGTSEKAGQAKEAAPAQTITPGDNLWQAAIKWVDHLFDCFAKYQYDFNASIKAPELKVDTERPQIFTGGARDPVSGEHLQYLRGRLYTRVYTLLVRAVHNEIDAYIVPNDLAIRFTANPGEFTRFLTGRIELKEGKPLLHLDGQSLSWDDTQALARELFGYLVRIAEGAITPQQPFSLGKASVAPPGGQAQAQAAVAQVQSQSPPASSPPEGRNGAAPAGFELQKPDMGLLRASGVPASAGGPGGLASAFEQVSTAFDRELKQLSDAGSQAFASQDTASAERLLKRATRLKSLRQEVLDTLSRWQAQLNDET